MPITSSNAYGWLMLAGIITSILVWSRLARSDARLAPLYIAALASAFLGAKLVYLAAEGWQYWQAPDRWVIFATGKSITGALLGGYLGVEVAKRFLKYPGITGDRFAVIAPLGISCGRIGCMLHGCCLGMKCDASWFTVTDDSGVARWPASQLELAFNLAALGMVLILQWKRLAVGQRFHLYLIAYGLFRFGHEFLRDTPRLVGPFSGYHLAAAAVAALGMFGYWQRRQRFIHSAPQTPPAAP
ncbi:MAG: prolipoprotein diacylglyceryl transferase family protein [Verrucomicrobiota bacterium]